MVAIHPPLRLFGQLLGFLDKRGYLGKAMRKSHAYILELNALSKAHMPG
jgi:hypothetical protein